MDQPKSLTGGRTSPFIMLFSLLNDAGPTPDAIIRVIESAGVPFYPPGPYYPDGDSFRPFAAPSSDEVRSVLDIVVSITAVDRTHVDAILNPGSPHGLTLGNFVHYACGAAAKLVSCRVAMGNLADPSWVSEVQQFTDLAVTTVAEALETPSTTLSADQFWVIQEEQRLTREAFCQDETFLPTAVNQNTSLLQWATRNNEAYIDSNTDVDHQKRQYSALLENVKSQFIDLRIPAQNCDPNSICFQNMLVTHRYLREITEDICSKQARGSTSVNVTRHARFDSSYNTARQTSAGSGKGFDFILYREG